LGFAAPLPILNGCPAISGRESELLAKVNQSTDHWKESTNINLINSNLAMPVHYICTNQLYLPGNEGELISHLQHMFNHSEEGDNHNAEPFAQCYKRLADIIPNLIKEGCNPRIMLDYSWELALGC
jgi:hypothetical protein